MLSVIGIIYAGFELSDAYIARLDTMRIIKINQSFGVYPIQTNKESS